MANKRKTLTPEEIKLIEHLRKFGYVPEQYLISNDIKFKQLETKFKKLKTKYDEALKYIARMEKLEVIFGDLVKKIPNTSNNIFKIDSKYRKSVSESVAVAVASDWHVEENVIPETVNHLNEYNKEIAAERIERFFKKIVDFTRIHRTATKIDILILAFLGDLITGFIHEEYRESNSMAPLVAIRFLQDLVVKGINYLLKYGDFKQIVIPCAYGNHGRTTKEIRHATAADNSFEQHFYYFLQFVFAHEKSINFVINSSYHKYVRVFDKYTIRFHHGDAIKYRGGVGGITIPVNKAIAQWNKSISADLDVFGHFHQKLDGGKFISNGSLIGYNAFALSLKAAYERPSQTFFLIEKDYGKTVVQPIFV